MMTISSPDKVLEKIEQVNQSTSEPDKKQTSRKSNQSASQQPKNSTSQPAQTAVFSSPASEQIEPKPTTEEVDNPTSQQVNLPELTSQEVEKSEIEEVKLLTSQEPELSAEIDGDSSDGGQPRDPGSRKVINSESQEVNQLTIQPVNQQPLRKATFQIDGGVLEALDRYHLQLLLDLGKRNAPYKETIVSEAIAQWLERAAKSPDRAVKSLLKRQEQR